MFIGFLFTQFEIKENNMTFLLIENLLIAIMSSMLQSTDLQREKKNYAKSVHSVLAMVIAWENRPKRPISIQRQNK